MAVVKLLLGTGKVDVDSKDSEVWTPLSRTAENGHGAIVKLLLDTWKVDVDSKDPEYNGTPLSWAAENGHEAVVELLLDTGMFDVDWKDSQDLYGEEWHTIQWGGGASSCCSRLMEWLSS